MAASEDDLKALMIASLDGDGVAYRALLDRIGGHLRGYYRGRLPQAGQGISEAEDLVQETLIAVHTRRHTYDRGQPFTPWLYAIARYKLIDHLRRTRATAMHVPIEAAQAITARSDQADAESTLDVGRLLARLPPKMRTAITDVKLQGLSVAEAAARSGMSESAVKVNVHRGLKALAAVIAREKKT